jgi:hypothetical protein
MILFGLRVLAVHVASARAKPLEEAFIGHDEDDHRLSLLHRQIDKGWRSPVAENCFSHLLLLLLRVTGGRLLNQRRWFPLLAS